MVTALFVWESSRKGIDKCLLDLKAQLSQWEYPPKRLAMSAWGFKESKRCRLYVVVEATVNAWAFASTWSLKHCDKERGWFLKDKRKCCQRGVPRERERNAALKWSRLV